MVAYRFVDGRMQRVQEPPTAPAPEPVQEDTPEDEAVQEKKPVELPPMTAPLAVWKDLAADLGIKITGMKKPEVIGAIQEHLR